MKAKDFYLQLPKLRLACRSWGPEGGLPVLALHGWLDNAASFDPLMPYLLELDPRLYVVAVDLPGHGHSEHLKMDYGFIFLDYVTVVSEIMEALQWERCILLGHSMGGAAALLTAAVLPERIPYSIFLDVLGPFSLPPGKAPQQYRHFLDKYNELKNTEEKYYQNLSSLIRAKSIANKISENSARLIIERNLKKTPQGYIWRSDKRLYLPSPLQLTEKQVHAFIRALKTSSLLLLSESQRKVYPRYFKAIPKRIRQFKKLKVARAMPGGHHFHMEIPEKTAQIIAQWLKSIEIDRVST